MKVRLLRAAAALALGTLLALSGAGLVPFPRVRLPQLRRPAPPRALTLDSFRPTSFVRLVLFR